MTTQLKSNWLAPALLLLLGSLNILFGAMQLDTIQQGPQPVPSAFTSSHYFAIPIPIVAHIVFGILFNLLGPLQFAPIIWQRWPAWHRWSGRLLFVSGIFVGLTGLWMNHFYPAYGGFLKYSGVGLSSIGLIVSLIIALRAIRRRNVQQHKAWMMRAVALALGPATQRVIILPLFFTLGGLTDLMIGLLIWTGFLINLAVAERVIWRDREQQALGVYPSSKKLA
ncbi:MAG: DUF2306 domain-containing protein [Chloroflexota bacterium]